MPQIVYSNAEFNAATADTPHPWIRLPAPGSRCRFTGLSRSSLYELVVPGPANGGKAPVRSVVLRKRGAQRGIRLIDYRSLMAYLDSLAAVADGNGVPSVDVA